MNPILRIAVPSPLRRRFDYLVPADHDGALLPGMRVKVPFGRREVVGLLLEVAAESELPTSRLKPALAVLDAAPLLPPDLLELLRWATAYYHHPAGEVMAAALPVPLRQGLPATVRGIQRWRLTAEGHGAEPEALRRAPRQVALLRLLQQAPAGLSAEALNEALENWRDAAKRLQGRGWLEVEEGPCLQAVAGDPTSAPELNRGQREAVAAIAAAEEYTTFLLDGVTGSGKTEVYLAAIEQVLAAGRQALVLVPEIGLTPQLLERFRRRLAVPIAVLHSGLSDTERLCAWLAAGRGEAPVVVGTRSALFTPLRNPGLIIVDEEHDGSFKQQEGFRYHARDLAVWRARHLDIPLLLGSATPSLESLHNTLEGRYTRLMLPERAGGAAHPEIRLLDLRGQPLEEGLSKVLLDVMARHLGRGEQVLLFINRRGFAPTLLCHDCGWVANCQRCDAHLTLHQKQGRLRCHHCGAERPIVHQCEACGSLDLRPLGQGTERIEAALQQRFPDTGIIRIDRDSTRRKGAMEALLAQAHSGEGQILIGTQMLAKGHHLPDVTLVGILEADQGLFSVDFRAGEKMAQQVLQVAGRAGRAERPGQVLIQTHHPDHPLLRQLIEQGYHAFAEAALQERREALLPPFSHMALLRAEATDARAPYTFLEAAREAAEALGAEGVMLLGPVPAPMERRAGRFRVQLLLQAEARRDLHRLLGPWLPQLEGLASGRKVRWSLDVDPVDMY